MIKPVYSNILIELIESETITKHGLIIKEDKNEEIKVGRIIKLSKSIDNNIFNENMKVLFNIKEGNKVFYNNKNYILIDKTKILGIIEGENYE